jgi:nucleotide-binding universal stress UspA family protein
MTSSVLAKVGFARILVPTDFSDISQRAIEYAKSIARLHSSEILLAHVSARVNPVSPPETEWFDAVAELQSADQQLEDMGAEFRSEGLNARTASLVGATSKEIIAAAIREKSDLIVVGTHGRTGLERLLFGSDAEALLRKSNCAVLVVGPLAQPVGARQWHPKDIVFASSLAPESATAAAYALLLADEHAASFTIFHIESSAPLKRNQGVLEFEEALAQLLPGKRVPHYSLHAPVAVDLVGPTIVDFARERRADLIVMGANAGSLATTHFLRGIVPLVAAEAPCPMLVLHKS